jgi:hypothetical protein
MVPFLVWQIFKHAETRLVTIHYREHGEISVSKEIMLVSWFKHVNIGLTFVFPQEAFLQGTIDVSQGVTQEIQGRFFSRCSCVWCCADTS